MRLLDALNSVDSLEIWFDETFRYHMFAIDGKKRSAKECITRHPAINPLVPSAANMRRNAKIFILILEEIIKKISYERRDYESVDKKILSLSMS